MRKWAIALGDFRVLDYCNLSKNHNTVPVRKKGEKRKRKEKLEIIMLEKNVMGGHFRQNNAQLGDYSF